MFKITKINSVVDFKEAVTTELNIRIKNELDNLSLDDKINENFISNIIDNFKNRRNSSRIFNDFIMEMLYKDKNLDYDFGHANFYLSSAKESGVKYKQFEKLLLDMSIISTNDEVKLSINIDYLDPEFNKNYDSNPDYYMFDYEIKKPQNVYNSIIELLVFKNGVDKLIPDYTYHIRITKSKIKMLNVYDKNKKIL